MDLTPTTWNHRVLMTKGRGEKSFCIHEVHYNKDGVIIGWTENPIAVCSDSLQGLSWQLDNMLTCLSTGEILARKVREGAQAFRAEA